MEQSFLTRPYGLNVMKTSLLKGHSHLYYLCKKCKKRVFIARAGTSKLFKEAVKLTWTSCHLQYHFHTAYITFLFKWDAKNEMLQNCMINILRSLFVNAVYYLKSKVKQDFIISNKESIIEKFYTLFSTVSRSPI